MLIWDRVLGLGGLSGSNGKHYVTLQDEFLLRLPTAESSW